jgi:hypothetical protein
VEVTPLVRMALWPEEIDVVPVVSVVADAALSTVKGACAVDVEWHRSYFPVSQ